MSNQDHSTELKMQEKDLAKCLQNINRIDQNSINQTIPFDFDSQQTEKPITSKKSEMNVVNTFLSNQNKDLPRYSKIHESIEILRRVSPEVFDDNLVDFLYSNIMCKYTGETPVYRYCRYSQNQVNPILSYLQEFSQNSGKVKMFLSKKSEADFCGSFQRRHGCRQLKDQKYIQRVVARAFCERSYGIEGLQQDIQAYNEEINIYKINYDSVMKQIILNTLYSLETFLTKTCQLNIQPLAKKFSENEVIDLLIHCRSSFNGDICQIIFNIIKGIYGLGKVTVTEANAVKLHNSVQWKIQNGSSEPLESNSNFYRALPISRTCLSAPKDKPINYDDSKAKMDIKPKTIQTLKKTKTKRSSMNPDYLDNIWTVSHEARFIQLYRNGASLASIRDSFKKQYPRQSLMFTVQSLRSKLYRIIRMSIKKLFYFVQKYQKVGLPELVKIDDSKMKVLIHNSVSLNARRNLMQVFVLQKFNQKIVTDAIVSVMDSLRTERQQNQITLTQATDNSFDDNK